MPELAAARESLAAAADAAFAAAMADEAVYGRYRAATALPRATDDEKAIRAAAIEEALVAATETPLALCSACLDMLPALQTIAACGTVHALSDARLGAYLAEVAVRGALLNVRGNAAMMKDAATAAVYRERADETAAAAAAAALAVERVAEGRADG
jgi:glutamate formiminotransferase/formiminotetrahydrofolate cyclodeaminase